MTRKHNSLRLITLGLGIAAFTSTVALAHAQQSDSQAQPDNTTNNKGDNKKGAMTADNQKETTADRELAKKIRKSIAGDSPPELRRTLILRLGPLWYSGETG